MVNNATNNPNSNLNPQDESHRLAVITPEEQSYNGPYSGEDDFADYNQMEASDYCNE